MELDQSAVPRRGALLEPTRYDPMIRKFANAHELW